MPGWRLLLPILAGLGLLAIVAPAYAAGPGPQTSTTVGTTAQVDLCQVVACTSATLPTGFAVMVPCQAATAGDCVQLPVIASRPALPATAPRPGLLEIARMLMAERTAFGLQGVVTTAGIPSGAVAAASVPSTTLTGAVGTQMSVTTTTTAAAASATAPTMATTSTQASATAASTSATTQASATAPTTGVAGVSALPSAGSGTSSGSPVFWPALAATLLLGGLGLLAGVAVRRMRA